MRIIFMGSPDFACPTLQALIDAEHDVVAVYAQPPRPAGRGQKLKPTAVHDLAAAQGLEVRTPLKLQNDALTELLATPADAIVVVAYGLLLPQAVLDHAPCLNLHPSALPRWRGAAPLQHTLLHGDTTTDICIMQLDIGMDTGSVYSRETLDVPADMTLEKLYEITSHRGAEMMLDVLTQLSDLTPTPQEEHGMTLAHKITPEMRPIDWAQSASIIHNHIRALSPTPAATAKIKNETWKILGSVLIDNSVKAEQVGEILFISAAGVVVACGENSALALTLLQRPSKKAMPAAVFAQGDALSVEDIFA